MFTQISEVDPLHDWANMLDSYFKPLKLIMDFWNHVVKQLPQAQSINPTNI